MDKTAKYNVDNLDKVEENLKNKPGNNEIVVAKENELQLDYDTEEVPEQFHKVLPLLRQRFSTGKIVWNKYHSSSGKNFHVIVTLPEDVTNQERIAWQAIFGSDYMREGLSLLRLINHIDNPTLLFMPKERTVLDTEEIAPRPARKFKEFESI